MNYIKTGMGGKEEGNKGETACAWNQVVFPSEEFVSLTQGFRALDGKEEQAFTKAFQKIKLGA